MKNTNKKGFTIVELVIVIAVIAILAAVLIPTFASIVKKANQSADIQATRQMNVVLATEEVKDIDTLIDLLSENGFNSKKALIPVSKDHTFYWNSEKNVIVLVDAEGKVVFPADEEYIAGEKFVSLENSHVFIDIAASDVATLEQALIDGNSTIKLEADLELTTEITLPAGSNVTLDLNGKKLTTAKPDGNRSKYLVVGDDSELNIINGTIEARGIQVNEGGKLVIDKEANLVINAVDANGGAALWINEGAEVTVNGGTFTALNGDCDESDYDAITYEPGVINNSGKLTINDGTFTAQSACYAVINSGELVINGGTFEASRGVIAASSGTVEINGGTFKTSEGATAHVIYASNGTVTINGGEFTKNGTGYKYCVDGSGSGSITVDGETLTAGQYK